MGNNKSIEEWRILRPQKLIALFGFILMGISPFLPWISASAPIIGLTLTRTGLEFATEAGFFALLFFIAGSIVVWFYNNFKRSGSITLIMGGWMLIETLVIYPQLQERITSNQESVLVLIGSGFYMLAIGVAITIIGGMTLLMLKPTLPQPPPPPISE